MKRTNKNIDINETSAEAQYLSSSISALNDMLYDFLGSGHPKLDEINKINAVAAAIQCLATKHAEDMLVLESEED